MVRFVHYIALFGVISRCYASMPMINLTLVSDFDGEPAGRAESTGLKPENEFQIYVENYFNRLVLKHIRCFYTRNPNTKFINAGLNKSGAGYVALGLASKEMIWPWRCNITNKYDKTHISVEFTIKFPNADRVVPAMINVNNEIINTTSSIIDETEIASGVYQYRTGELVKFTCTRDKGNTMSLNSSIFSTQSQTYVSELTAYIKMTDKHDGLSIDCNVGVTLPPNINTYIVRLKFSKIQFNSDKYPQFVVNGLELVPKKIYDTNEYQYEYYDGETLSIMGSMGHGDEPWQCITDRDYTHQLGHALEQSKGLNNLTVTLHNDIKKPVSPRLVCNIGTYMANLEIKPIPTSYYPNIIGLSLANTLYRYKQSDFDYKIKYSHPDKQNLSLTCASYMAECKWDIRNNEVISKDEEFIRSQGMLMSKRLFVPRKDCNSTIITCKCKIVDNIKYYKTIAEIQCERTKQEAEMITKEPNKVQYSYLLMAGAAVAIIAVVASGVVIVWWIRRDRKRAANANENQYECVDYSACLHTVARTHEASKPDAVTNDHVVSSPTNPGLSSDPDISSRPPCPPPPRKDEENKKYVHYDVVYEERFNRLVMMRGQMRGVVRK